MKVKRGKAAIGVVVAGLAAMGADRIFNFSGDSEAENRAAMTAAATFNTAVVSEMDARFADQKDPFNKDLFTFDSLNAKILSERTELRWSEARSRVDNALEDSLEAASAGRGQDNHRDAAFACGMWILNSGGPDAAAFQPPTVEAYLHGDPVVATTRCLGAITARVVGGELTQIQFPTGMAAQPK